MNVTLYEINRIFDTNNFVNQKTFVMKRLHRRYPLITSFILFFGVLIICAWQNPSAKKFMSQFKNVNQTDTFPKDNYNDKSFNSEDFDKAMKELDESMANLDIAFKNLNVNIDKEVKASIDKINFDEIAKETEASIKAIDWENIQKEVNVSMQKAQEEIAKIDFTKMQNEMKTLQEKLQSEEFKSQFNSEKLQKQINDAMSNAKESIEKAKEKLQHMKDFTDALAADGLIDKKKGFTLEWKSSSLFINGKEQSKEISDKYRKYEDVGKIKILPDGAEHF